MDDEQKKIKNRVDKEAEKIKVGVGKAVIRGDYGACNSCSRFVYIERELDILSFCSYDENRRSSTINKVIKCSNFSPKSMLSIGDMWAIAKLVDIEDESGGIGFGIGDKKGKIKITETQHSRFFNSDFDED
jgi:hypothetical protein